MMGLPEKAAAAMRRERMLRPGERVTVALSGGADSMALLFYFLKNVPELREAQERETGAAVSALHVNHGLRGEESDRDEAFVRGECARLGVPLTVVRVDAAAEAARDGEGVEAAGRRLRYAALAEAVGDGGVAATAHTADDNAETLLMHLARGCGLRGLGGIPPVRPLHDPLLKRSPEDGRAARVIRPLIDCTRAEVEAYCRAEGIAFVTDSTNANVAYTRNRVRHTVIPALRAVNPHAVEAMGRTATRMRGLADMLDVMARDALTQAERDGGWDAARLAALPEPLRGHTLLMAAAGAGVTGNSRTAEDMARLLSPEGGAAALGGGIFARVSQGRLALLTEETYPRRGASGPPRQNGNGREKTGAGQGECALIPGKSCLFYERKLTLRLMSLSEYEKWRNVHKNLLKNAFDYDTISGKLSVRSRREGDSYRPDGRGGTKTLKKLFIESRVPAERRDGVPVVCDGEGIVLVCGHGCDERVRIGAATKTVAAVETE